MSDENKNCLLCGATSEKKTTLLWECLRCGLLFKNPDSFSSFIEEKARYLTHNNDLHDEGYLKYLSKLWAEIPKPEGDVLDFGCGPSKGLEALAQKQNIKNISVDSYDPIFFKNVNFEKKYDIVYASECLEHFYNPKKDLRLLFSFLKPGGVLAISTVFSDGVDLKSWWYLKDHTHVVFYSSKTFDWIRREFSFKTLFIKSPHIILVKN